MAAEAKLLRRNGKIRSTELFTFQGAVKRSFIPLHPTTDIDTQKLGTPSEKIFCFFSDSTDKLAHARYRQAGDLCILLLTLTALNAVEVHIPPKLRGAFNQIAKKDDVKRLVTRRTRDVLDRALNSIASIYRDVAVLQNNAEDSVGLINLENRSSITEVSVRLNRAGAVTRLDEVAHARKRLAGNGNPLLVFESLFCALIS